MPFVAIVVLANMLLVSVKSTLPNVLLDLEWIFPIVWVPLGNQVIEATAKRPNIYLWIEEVLWAVLEDLRSRVIQMSTKALVLQKLLEVVGHSNKIQLDEVTTHVDPRRVHISKNQSLIMHMANAFSQLSED